MNDLKSELGKPLTILSRSWMLMMVRDEILMRESDLVTFNKMKKYKLIQTQDTSNCLSYFDSQKYGIILLKLGLNILTF